MANFNPKMVPSRPVEIDWGHPIAQGLVCLIIPGGASGLADLTGNFPTPALASAAAIGSTNSGLALHSSVLNSGAQALVGTQMYGLSHTQGTVHWSGDILSAANPGGCVFGLNYNDSGAIPYHAFDIALDGSNNVYAGVDDAAGSTFYGAELVSGWAAANGITFTGTFVAGGSLTLFRNGVSAATTGAPASAIGLSSTSRLNIANWPPSSTVQSLSNTRWGALWNQALTPDLIAWLNAEPFAVLRPIQRRTYYGSFISTTSSISSASTKYFFFDF